MIILTIASSVTMLTFSWTLLAGLLELISVKSTAIKRLMKRNISLIWSITLLTAGGIGGRFFKVALPTCSPDMSTFEIGVLMIGMILLTVCSGYNPGRKLYALVRFCLIFPLGEEILYRGGVL